MLLSPLFLLLLQRILLQLLVLRLPPSVRLCLCLCLCLRLVLGLPSLLLLHRLCLHAAPHLIRNPLPSSKSSSADRPTFRPLSLVRNSTLRTSLAHLPTSTISSDSFFHLVISSHTFSLSTSIILFTFSQPTSSLYSRVFPYGSFLSRPWFLHRQWRARLSHSNTHI